ncbi:MAG: TIM-barrel domain-containing protein [Ferruginibacter sp.]
MKILICVTLLLVNASLFAQSPVKDIGNVSNVKISGGVVNIITENAFADITIYNANIIRVRIDKQKMKYDLSYAVVQEPAKTNARIIDETAQVTITTDSLKVLITKEPFSLAFYTPGGKLINEDEKGLHTSWVGDEVTSYRHMQENERFIGLGEKTGNLDRHGNGYTNWNTDAYGYATGQDPIYSSVPFYIGIHHDINYGIFLDNTYQTDFNFGASNDRFSSFGARNGEMNYYFIYHDNVQGIIKAYTWLTGRMKLPPLWSLGYQQNRYTYYPDTEVIRIAETLREKKIPADGITLDIHYMDRYQLFTWDKQRFPDPKKMTSRLKALGFETTVIVDPGIKIEPGAAAFERGLKENVYIKYSDGKNYAGQVWPGWCYFTDYTSEKGRNFWRREVKFFSENGVKGIWNDMNEIATWGQKMSTNVIFDFEGHKASHLQAHNVYGSLMARTSYEGAKAATNERPFILTRAGYAGMQRYTAIWTGDNRSEDDHMLLGVRLLNSLGLSGVPFTGMDVGGFIGTPTPQLYARWIQLGAFTPYFRNHSALNTRSAEPWTFGEEVTDISRNYIGLRYKLMPYLYSTFYEATQNGMPVSRSLAIEYTFDPQVYRSTFQNQFLFGQSLLIIPLESVTQLAKIYLPKGKWYNLYNDEIQDGDTERLIEAPSDKLPVYVKEGSIIPMQSLIQTTAEIPSDTLSIHIYKGATLNTWQYYEDDGRSFENEKGVYYQRQLSYDPIKKNITFSEVNGSFPTKFKNIMLVLHGFDQLQNITVNGSQVTLKKAGISILKEISAARAADISNVLQAVFKNQNRAITIGL